MGLEGLFGGEEGLVVGQESAVGGLELGNVGLHRVEVICELLFVVEDIVELLN